MDIYEFAVDFPELFQRLDGEIEQVIQMNQMNGDRSLREWDEFIDSIVRRYEQEDAQNDQMNMMRNQQFNPRDGFRDMDRGMGRDRHRDRFRRPHNRRRRDFDVRDLSRVLFLRRLFDRDRCC